MDGVDVSGRTIAMIAHVPGQHPAGQLEGRRIPRRQRVRQQEEALLGVYTGKLGGPVAELVKLVGEVVSVQKVPITFDVQGGKARSSSATPVTPSSSRIGAQAARPPR